MQVLNNINKTKDVDILKHGMSVPSSLKPKRYVYSSSEAEDFMSFISSQHPLINVWLVFSLISIGLLSVLLYVI